MEQIAKNEVIKANIDLHTALASKYNTDEPHFRPENVKQVRECLRTLKERVGAETMLDIGCGTGFMINIAKDLGFKKIVGLDVTPSMLAQVDRSGADIQTIETDVTEPFPVPAGAFDLVTAYTFLSHLPSLDVTFREACKALRAGGVFHSDLDPNYYFWQDLQKVSDSKSYHPYVQREINHTKNNDQQIFEKYGVEPEVYNKAEFQKSLTGGMREEDLEETLLSAGFSRVDFKYNWFMGAAVINNDPSQSPEARQLLMRTIDEYLQAAMPMSRSLYKYISFTAWKS